MAYGWPLEKDKIPKGIGVCTWNNSASLIAYNLFRFSRYRFESESVAKYHPINLHKLIWYPGYTINQNEIKIYRIMRNTCTCIRALSSDLFMLLREFLSNPFTAISVTWKTLKRDVNNSFVHLTRESTYTWKRVRDLRKQQAFFLHLNMKRQFRAISASVSYKIVHKVQESNINRNDFNLKDTKKQVSTGLLWE